MGEFSRYASFLELAFGVNLLFCAWDGIYENLSQLSQQNTAQGGQALELARADSDQQQTITRHRERCDRCRTWMRKAGRATGLVVATAIAVSLLLMAPDQAVNAWQFGFIAGAGAVVPLLLAIMVIGDYGYTKWSASPAGTAPTATAAPAESAPAESAAAESAPAGAGQHPGRAGGRRADGVPVGDGQLAADEGRGAFGAVDEGSVAHVARHVGPARAIGRDSRRLASSRRPPRPELAHRFC